MPKQTQFIKLLNTSLVLVVVVGNDADAAPTAAAAVGLGVAGRAATVVPSVGRISLPSLFSSVIYIIE